MQRCTWSSAKWRTMRIPKEQGLHWPIVCVEANTREMHGLPTGCQFLFHWFPRCIRFGGTRDDVQDNETLRTPTKNVIRNSYEGFKCCVKAKGEKGHMFDVKTGVRQGNVWSPILFGLVINYVLANSVQREIDIGRCVADLDFADDIALLGLSDSEVQANLHRIESSAEAVGLMINVGKTKNMVLNAKNPEPVYILLKKTWKFSQETTKAFLGHSSRPKNNLDYSLAGRCWWARRRMRVGPRH